MRNNVTRMLQARGVPFTAHSLPRAKLSAVEAASHLHVPADRVFKSIVISWPAHARLILALVPGDRQVDLKAVARLLGAKKVVLPTERQTEKLTGLQAGGISPLALLHRQPIVLLDLSAVAQPDLYLSGGQRGLNICMRPADLITLTSARTGPIAR